MERLVPLVALFAAGCVSDGPPYDISASGCFGGLPALIAVYFGAATVLALVVWMTQRSIRFFHLANDADRPADRSADRRSSEHPGELREGPTVLTGRVASEGEAAVRVEIELHGTEDQDSSGDWSHRWEEKERRVRVRPFELVLGSGERVRVEPVSEVYLADALDGVIQINRAARVLVAELSPGEAVIAVGDLERRPIADGYRGSSDRWVLVPPRRGRGPMMLSTEPLGARFRRRARGAAVAVFLAIIATCALHAGTLGYHLRVWRGETVVGAYVHTRRWTTESDDTTVHHRRLTVKLPDGSEHGEEIPSYGSVGAAYVRHVPSQPWATSFGRTATLHGAIMAGHVVLPFLLLLFFRWLTPNEWYEGRKQRSKGSGRL